ncbi:MAG: hypothetical protein Q8942_15355 [Bacillota bacterium]|nr:hypothetical protein [Bacillota bacterium]
MKRLIIILITLIILLISGSVLYSQVLKRPLHQSVFKQDVSYIQIYGTAGTKKIDDEVTKNNIIKWFNQAVDIRINNDLAGTTPELGIIINLKSGKRIAILNSGADFEIQRNDVMPESISYWAKQQDLKAYLGKLAAKSGG